MIICKKKYDPFSTNSTPTSNDDELQNTTSLVYIFTSGVNQLNRHLINTLPMVYVTIILSGCSADPVKLDYTGLTQANKFQGEKVAIVSNTAPESRFIRPDCTVMASEDCRTWTFSQSLTIGVYASMLQSALKTEGAEIIADPAKADIVISTTMSPNNKDGHLIVDHYELGHTVAYNLIPLHHTRFYHQSTTMTDSVVETRNQKVIAQISVPLNHEDEYEGSTTVGGSDYAAAVSVYKQEQGSALDKILTVMQR